MDCIDVDCLVIGAGVVGLSVARRMAMAGREVFVIEKESDFGTQTSSRNSEVIHAGIYYPKNSLKAKLCVRGKELLYAYCQAHHIPYKCCGKVIVAKDHGQRSQLMDIQAHAKNNGVEDIRFLERTDLVELAAELQGDCALFSPSTGVIDSHSYMLQLLSDIEANGGQCVFNSEVQIIKADSNKLELLLNGDEAIIRAKICINAAGLNAIPLIKSSGLIAPEKLPKAYYAKGSYFSYSGQVPFSQLIYPLPEVGGLGIHLSLDLQGNAKFGPDVEWLETDDPKQIEYQVSADKLSRFHAAISQYWPGIEKHKMHPDYSGVRPKVSAPNEASADFIIQDEHSHGVHGLVNLMGIESPGLTSSLAIADYVFAILNR